MPTVRANGEPGLSPRRIAGVLFAASALIFLGIFVLRNAGQLRAHEWTIRPALLLASIALNIVGLFWGVGVWRLLLRKVGFSVPFLHLARIWFLSSLGRYIPGKIWQFVGAAQLGTGVAIPRTITVATLAAHTGFFFVGAFLVAVYFLPTEILGSVGLSTSTIRWIAPLALLLAHPAIIRIGLSLISRTGGQRIDSWTPGWIDGLQLVTLSLVNWVISGLSLYLFILSVTATSVAGPVAIVGINALTFIVGYAVFIAPAGLGAKEGALTVLLSLYLPAPVAAVIAIAARLWTVAAEVLPTVVLFRRPSGAGGPGSLSAESTTAP